MHVLQCFLPCGIERSTSRKLGEKPERLVRCFHELISQSLVLNFFQIIQILLYRIFIC